VYPQAQSAASPFGAAWNLTGIGDVNDVKALLDDLERRECVNTSRVYATRRSYGAAMTDLLACTMAERVAAVAGFGVSATPSVYARPSGPCDLVPRLRRSPPPVRRKPAIRSAAIRDVGSTVGAA